MSIEELIYAHALDLAGVLEHREAGLLKLFAKSAARLLTGRLTVELSQPGCREALIDAGSLYALAALLEADSGPGRFSAGELTVEKGNAAMTARALREQGDRVLGPFAQDGFVFRGV